MASPTIRNDLKALHRLIDQADLVLDTIPNPHPSMASARESLNAALSFSKDLIKRVNTDSVSKNAAAALGSRGGNATLASKGPEHFSKLAGMRKTRAGGRPRNDENS